MYNLININLFLQEEKVKRKLNPISIIFSGYYLLTYRCGD